MKLNRGTRRRIMNSFKKSTNKRNHSTEGCFGKTRNVPKGGWDYEGNSKKLKFIKKNLKTYRQVIAHSEEDRNNVIFSEECLKECVNNLKDKSLPVNRNFDKKTVIGHMNNFEFKEGKILADVYLSEEDFNESKVVRCSYQILNRTLDTKPIKINRCAIVDGGLVDKQNDAEKGLT